MKQCNNLTIEKLTNVNFSSKLDMKETLMAETETPQSAVGATGKDVATPPDQAEAGLKAAKLEIEGGADADEEDGRDWAGRLKKAGAALATREGAPPPPEGPGGPEEQGGVEPSKEHFWFLELDLWSPEFKAVGRALTRELDRLESLPNEERYNAENGPKLNLLYSAWVAWVDRDEDRATSRPPFDPNKVKPDQLVPERVAEEHVYDITGLPSFKDVMRVYKNPSSYSSAEVVEAKKQLSAYFHEAKKIPGLLGGVDESLKELYVEIMQGMEWVNEEVGEGAKVNRRRLTKAQIMARVKKDREAMSQLGEGAFNELMRSDPAEVDLAKIAKFEGVWDLYADLAVDRFALLLNGGGLIRGPHINGEFDAIAHVEAEGREEFQKLAQQTEVFWRPMWSNYFEVTARTLDQFQTAIDSFTNWVRFGLGKSPQEMFQRINGFKDALTTAGIREHLSDETMKRFRWRLEGLTGAMGAYHKNENYKEEEFKQFWDFLVQDEGPQRLVELGKAHKGKVAAFLWMFDHDPRCELLFSAHGSRGQLQAIRESWAQRRLIAHTEDMLIADAIGLDIKGYHPDDPEKKLSDDTLEDNLEELVNFKSDKDFKNLFETFTKEEKDQVYKHLLHKKKAKVIHQMVEEGVDARHLSDEDREIYAEFKDQTSEQLDLTPSEERTWIRLSQARRIQQLLSAGRDDEIKGIDARLYQENRSAFELACELYGITAQKAERSGGVFLAHRRDEHGKRFTDYMPIHWVKKVAMFAQNWTEATYGGELEKGIQERLGRKGIPAFELAQRVVQARRLAIWALKTYGFDAKLWDFTLMRDGKVIDINTLGYVKDKFGRPYGENRKSKDPAERLRYCVPENPRILGYNSRGEGVILVFDDDGKPVGLEYDEKGNAVIYDQNTETIEIIDKDKKKTSRTRQRIKFDNLNRNTKALPMMINTPTLQADGTPLPVKVQAYYENARHHIYASGTHNPYWGYQEEDTSELLKKANFQAAERIKKGESLPEQEKPHATQLILVDPTLQRVGHFRDKEHREDVVLLAAVERSYQRDWITLDELHQNFFPEDADDEYNDIQFVLQDQGGCTKQWIHARAEAARWTDMKTRRLRTLIPVLPMHFASMVETFGAPGGVLDVLRMMNYGFKLGVGYRMVGQFASEKWVNQLPAANDEYAALFGFIDAQGKVGKEGMGEKVNNEGNRMQQNFNMLYDKLFRLLSNDEEADNKYFESFRSSLERFVITCLRARVLETDTRGERTPKWLEGVEVYQRNPDGSLAKDDDGNYIYNRNIDNMMDTGSSRHSLSRWFWTVIAWIRSEKKNQGQQAYPEDAMYYEIGDNYTTSSKRKAGIKDGKTEGHEAELQTHHELLGTKIIR